MRSLWTNRNASMSILAHIRLATLLQRPANASSDTLHSRMAHDLDQLQCVPLCYKWLPPPFSCTCPSKVDVSGSTAFRSPRRCMGCISGFGGHAPAAVPYGGQLKERKKDLRPSPGVR